MSTSSSVKMAPVASKQRAARRPLQSRVGARVRNPAPLRVALIDDDQRVHDTLRKSFRQQAGGWIFEGYTSPNKGLQHISQSRPDAVLLGSTIAGVSGIDIAHKLKLV